MNGPKPVGNVPPQYAIRALTGAGERATLAPPDNGFYASGTFVGWPQDYRQTGYGPGVGPVGLPYSVPANQPDTMYNQPAFALFAPMATRHNNYPDPTFMWQWNNLGSGGLPEFFRPANRAASSGTGLSGANPGVHMMIVPPQKYNAEMATIRRSRDVRLGTQARPSRIRTPAPNIGS